MQATSWQISPASVSQPPEWLLQMVQSFLPEVSGQSSGQSFRQSGQFAAQLLWQRGLAQPQQVLGFIDVAHYQPTPAAAFGTEMKLAVDRLRQAYQDAEKVAIWGDFDADGATATAVLWEGLGQFFAADRLTYYIPNRLTESHGLAEAGIRELAAQGYSLIVTCDTGSTNLTEIDLANSLGIDLIITDHHVLPTERPPVTAILNPRYFAADHPLANLSGVAVAYKLVEALYAALPDVAEQPLTDLLDLVAIGLIADLVELRGDCRYLAQKGIAQLQKNQDLVNPPRPGIAKLLELCRRSGDRPTDISFGLGPRINAISRIYGDAGFCVELLTSRDRERCQQLAMDTELANARRKVLQRDVMQQARAKLTEVDLSTTRVIVLADPQWAVGILGLVAAQVAQEYGRPAILLSTALSEVRLEAAESEATESGAAEPEAADAGSVIQPQLARGSARSVNPIDLYKLLQTQAHLLHRFGGHPLAAGLSLPVENIALFTEAVNQQLRQVPIKAALASEAQADLTVTVADLGKSLFQELKLLEPYGMGNPVPKLLIRNCWFSKAWHRKIQDAKGGKLEYIKTEFEIRDDSTEQGFPGVWWGHYKDELPHVGQSGERSDVLVELDFSNNRYEIRLLQLQTAALPVPEISELPTSVEILDWRGQTSAALNSDSVELIADCPSSWEEIRAVYRQAIQAQRPLALAYSAPVKISPSEVWQQLLDLANQLSQSREKIAMIQIQHQLGISEPALQIGLQALRQFGFNATVAKTTGRVTVKAVKTAKTPEAANSEALDAFFNAIKQEHFMRRYFYQVPLATLQAAMK